MLLEPMLYPLAAAIVLVQYRRNSRRAAILLVRVEYQTGTRIEDHHVLASGARMGVLDRRVDARRSDRQHRSGTPGQRPRRVHAAESSTIIHVIHRPLIRGMRTATFRSTVAIIPPKFVHERG